MAGKTVKSKLMQKYGNRMAQVAAAVSEKPVSYGNARLPGGITNGIAKLTVVEVGEVAQGKQNAGENYLRLAGVAVSPESVVVDGVDVPVAGLQTSVMRMLCPTTTRQGKETSFDENFEVALNELRKLGGPDLDVTDFDGAVESLNAAAQDPESPIYFRFSTSQSAPTPEFPDPKTWENWYGVKGLENYVPEDAAAGATQDDTAPPARTVPPKAAPSANGKAPAAAAGKTTSRAAPPPAAGQPDPNPDGAADEPDVDALLADANAGNAEGLQEAALAAGLDKDEVDAAPDWDAVADMLRERLAGGVTSEEPAGGDTANPQVEDVFFYKPPKMKKAIECEVTAVNQKKKTVTLKNLTDGKTLYPDVPFTALEEGQ